MPVPRLLVQEIPVGRNLAEPTGMKNADEFVPVIPAQAHILELGLQQATAGVEYLVAVRNPHDLFVAVQLGGGMADQSRTVGLANRIPVQPPLVPNSQ